MKAARLILQILVVVAFLVLAGLVGLLGYGLYLNSQPHPPVYVVIPPFTATPTPFGFASATPDVTPTLTPKPTSTRRATAVVRPATLTATAAAPSATAGPTSNTAPTVSLTYPTAGLSVPSGQPVVIQAAVTAPAGLVHTDIWVDGILYASIVNPVFGGTTMAVSQSWTSSAAGAHTIAVLAYDRLNQASLAATVSIQLTAPVTLSAWIAQPFAPDGQVVFEAGDTIQLSYWGSAVHGVSRLELWIDGQLVSSNTNASQSTTMNVQQTWSSTVIGEHTLFVRVYDTQNQTADSASLQIGLTDRNPPSVALAAPANGAQLASGQTIQVMVSANDSKGVTSIALWVDNALYTTWNSASAAGQTNVATSLAWAAPAAGSHTLYLVAKDSVDLTTTTASITVTVLPPPPTATTSPTVTATRPTPTGTPTRAPTATLKPSATLTPTRPTPTGTPTPAPTTPPASATLTPTQPAPTGTPTPTATA